MQKILCGSKTAVVTALALIFSMLLSLRTDAVTFTPNFTVESDAAYLVNLDKDLTLYEKNADKRCYPASLTKIMTAIIVLENVPDLDNTYAEAPLVVFDELYMTGASTADYSRGEIASVNDLMHAMLMASACEAAGTLAYHVGGESIPNFIDMMNTKAQELGCTGTHFANPHGLFDPDQYTTARDMAIITQYAIENYPKFMEIASTVEYQLSPTNKRPDGATVYHTNSMLKSSSDFYYPYAKGIKTGTLDESGRNLITMASCDGNNYLLVTMGAPMTLEDGTKANFQYTDHKNVYEWAFNTFEYMNIMRTDEAVSEVSVRFGQDKDYVSICPKDPYSTLWPNTYDTANINKKITKDEIVQAPVHKGDKLGTIELQLSGQTLFTTDLIAMEDIEISMLDYNIDLAKKFTKSSMFKIAIAGAVVLVMLYVIIYISAGRKKKRRIKRVKKSRRF